MTDTTPVPITAISPMLIEKPCRITTRTAIDSSALNDRPIVNCRALCLMKSPMTLRLGLPQAQGDGLYKIQVAYGGTDALVVEGSTNLVNWSPWAGTNAHDGLFEFVITNLLTPQPRFFRLKK